MFKFIVLAVCLALPAKSQSPEPKTATIRFYAPVNEETVARLLNAVDTRIREGNKRIRLLISSPGGSVFAGLSAYHYLKGVPAEIVTHNFGTCDSIATVIYSAGSKRYAVPHARFLLHGVSATFPANLPVEEGLLEERLKVVQQEVRAIAAVIAETAKRPVEEVQQKIISRTVLNVEQALAWGLVQEVRAQLYEDGVQVVPIGDSPTSPNLTKQIAGGISTNALRLFSTPFDLSTEKVDSFSVPADLQSPKLDLKTPATPPT